MRPRAHNDDVDAARSKLAKTVSEALTLDVANADLDLGCGWGMPTKRDAS
ncbi:MAG TPA: hypothetical protein VGO16_00515 [Pseudonocardiaceae bacterium]|nr:hypothetical protein [Pseudonocardiaceae bacterium]